MDETNCKSRTVNYNTVKHKTKTYLKQLHQEAVLIEYPTQINYRHQRYIKSLGQFWCSTDNQTIDFFDANRQFLHRSPVLKNFKSKDIQNCWVDQQGGFWWKNTQSQTVRTLIIKNKFQHYLNGWSESANQAKQKVPVRGMFQYKDQLFINSSIGAFQISLNDQSVQKLPAFNNDASTNNKIASYLAFLLEDSSNLWITSEGYQILKYNLTTQTYQSYNYLENAPKARFHWSIHRDKKGNLWVGHTKGLSLINDSTQSIQLFNQYNGFDDLQKSSIFHFHENEEGLWVASSSGLYILDGLKGPIKHFGKDALPYTNIAHIHEDNAGIFWLATKGGGLIRWDKAQNQYQQFTVRDNLSDLTIYAVYEDDNNYLWLSSNQGIMRFNKETHIVQTFLENDGITHKEFNTISHYQNKAGQIFFGGLSGVTALNPNDFTNLATAPPHLSLSSITKYDYQAQTITQIKANYEDEEILLINPMDRLATIRVSLLDYQNSSNHRFAYKIKDVDSDWHYTSDPLIRLDGIEAGGVKTMLIKACNSNGIWTPKPLEIYVHKLVPFTRTPYFWFTFAVILTLGIWVMSRWRLRRLHDAKEKLEKEVVARTIQLQQQAEELKELNGFKSQFFANISHELRTPLTLILGPLAQAIDNPTTSPSLSKTLKTALRNGKSLQYLIEEILDLSKLDAHKLEVQEKTVALLAFAERMVDNFNSQAKIQSINLQLDFQSSEDLMVLLDENKVEKIIINLLSNAIKFTPKGGLIRLVVLTEEQHLKLEVHDTGKGIPADDLPHIFDRFYQSKQAQTSFQNGTGIGLAFSKELTKLMGGSLTVESKENKGSIFYCTLPLKTGKPTETVSTSNTKNSAILEWETPMLENIIMPAASQTILLVEDNVDMRYFIEDLLQPTYRVIHAGNGLQAQQLMASKAVVPNLIISDVMMPEMDGFELLRWIKSESDLRGIPVIMLTARSAEKSKLSALTIGVDDYLTKPFSPKELLARAKNLIYNASHRLVPVEMTESSIPAVDQPKETTAPPVETPEPPPLSESDQKWIKLLEEVVLRNIDNPEFGSAQLADTTKVSLSSLKRRIKTITGLSAGRYIRDIRLHEAKQYLENGTYRSIAEVAYAVGFEAPYYFSKVYEKHFGKKVQDYIK